jgi:serine/threonine protein kinase
LAEEFSMNADRPQLIGLPTRIRLIEPLGSGSSCTVWRARDTHSGRDFAIKLLPLPDGDALAAERLQREARALSRLSQIEGAISLHQVGIAADGTAWLLLDFAPGGSLQDCIQALAEESVRPAAASGPRTQTLAASLFLTLAQAHTAGVIHGDISPANILFGESGQPLLADFGMGALLGGGEGTLGLVGFTPAYAAPERFRGAPPDQASDVFALAATLWHWEFSQPPGASFAELRPKDSEMAATQRDWMLGALSELPTERPDAQMVADSLNGRLTRHKGNRWRWKYPRRDVE